MPRSPFRMLREALDGGRKRARWRIAPEIHPVGLPLRHPMAERAGERWRPCVMVCPSPRPSPRSCLAGRGSHPGQWPAAPGVCPRFPSTVKTYPGRGRISDSGAKAPPCRRSPKHGRQRRNHAVHPDEVRSRGIGQRVWTTFAGNFPPDGTQAPSRPLPPAPAAFPPPERFLQKSCYAGPQTF
jgi:hypothetical protein